MKPQACFDIDGTLARGLLIVALIEREHQKGLITDKHFKKITGLLEGYKAGEIEYEATAEELVQLHAAGLRGQSYSDLERHAQSYFTANKDKLFYPFGQPAVRILKTNNDCLIVTAEPGYAAEAVGRIFGIEDYRATVYELDEKRFTGRITTSLAHRSSKHAALAGLHIAYAFGDTDGDIEMLGLAQHAICINPTKQLKAVAHEHNWRIFDGDDPKLISLITSMVG